MEGLWSFLVFFVGISYVGMPILIRFTNKMAAKPTLLPLNSAELPPEVTRYLFGTAEALQGQGFAEPYYLALPDQVPNVRAYLIMMINRQTGDKAMVTAMFATSQGITRLSSTYLEYSTRFENGQMFDTMNSRVLSSFQAGPDDNKTQLPSVQDPALLYQIHQYQMNRLARGGPKVTYAPGEAAAYLAHVLVESYEEQVRFGRLYHDKGANAYRPTWKGAFLMTWGMLWPINALRNLTMRRKERTLLREFSDWSQSRANLGK